MKKALTMAALLVAALTGCGSSPEDAFIGKWKQTMTGEVVEIHKEGDNFFMWLSPAAKQSGKNGAPMYATPEHHLALNKAGERPYKLREDHKMMFWETTVYLPVE